MKELLLKIETTGLDYKKHNLLRIMLLNLDGLMIYNRIFNADENPCLQYNYLRDDILTVSPLYNNFDFKILQSYFKDSIVWSYKKEFDTSFLPFSQELEESCGEWKCILSTLKKRKRIPDLDCYKCVYDVSYRKALNIIELMRQENLFNPQKEEISIEW